MLVESKICEDLKPGPNRWVKANAGGAAELGKWTEKRKYYLVGKPDKVFYSTKPASKWHRSEERNPRDNEEWIIKNWIGIDYSYIAHIDVNRIFITYKPWYQPYVAGSTEWIEAANWQLGVVADIMFNNPEYLVVKGSKMPPRAFEDTEIWKTGNSDKKFGEEVAWRATNDSDGKGDAVSKDGYTFWMDKTHITRHDGWNYLTLEIKDLKT